MVVCVACVVWCLLVTFDVCVREKMAGGDSSMGQQCDSDQ